MPKFQLNMDSPPRVGARGDVLVREYEVKKMLSRSPL